jgi:hypothetical protein
MSFMSWWSIFEVTMTCTNARLCARMYLSFLLYPFVNISFMMSWWLCTNKKHVCPSVLILFCDRNPFYVFLTACTNSNHSVLVCLFCFSAGIFLMSSLIFLNVLLTVCTNSKCLFSSILVVFCHQKSRKCLDNMCQYKACRPNATFWGKKK